MRSSGWASKRELSSPRPTIHRPPGRCFGALQRSLLAAGNDEATRSRTPGLLEYCSMRGRRPSGTGPRPAPCGPELFGRPSRRTESGATARLAAGRPTSRHSALARRCRRDHVETAMREAAGWIIVPAAASRADGRARGEHRPGSQARKSLSRVENPRRQAIDRAVQRKGFDKRGALTLADSAGTSIMGGDCRCRVQSWPGATRRLEGYARDKEKRPPGGGTTLEK
jgi:hypothetical protein